MFDHIGTDLDEEAGRRASASVAITTALLAGLAGVLIGASAVWLVEAAPIVGEPVDVEIGELVQATPSTADDPLPAAPAARPAGGPSKPSAEPSEPAPLAPPKTVPLVSSDTSGTGDPDGEGPGDGPGDPAGRCTSGPCGEAGDGGGGGGTGGPRVFHHSELQVRRRVDPRWPDAATPLGLGEQRCLARVSIDEEGVPYEVEVESCPRVFHEATREALLAWRWVPPRDGKRKIRATTTIAVNYRQR